MTSLDFLLPISKDLLKKAHVMSTVYFTVYLIISYELLVDITGMTYLLLGNCEL